MQLWLDASCRHSGPDWAEKELKSPWRATVSVVPTYSRGTMLRSLPSSTAPVRLKCLWVCMPTYSGFAWRTCTFPSLSRTPGAPCHVAIFHRLNGVTRLHPVGLVVPSSRGAAARYPTPPFHTLTCGASHRAVKSSKLYPRRCEWPGNHPYGMISADNIYFSCRVHVKVIWSSEVNCVLIPGNKNSERQSVTCSGSSDLRYIKSFIYLMLALVIVCLNEKNMVDRTVLRF